MPKDFQAERDPEILPKLRSIPLLSAQAEALELVGKSSLGDCTINTLMLKLFAARTDTIPVDTSTAGNVMNGYMPVDSMKNIFSGVTDEKSLSDSSHMRQESLVLHHDGPIIKRCMYL